MPLGVSSTGVKVIAVPKTMDNDVRNTEYCIGFSTAITRAMDAIDRERSTVGSHERIGIFRVFGRDAGYTALYTAYVTGVRCCLPEYEVDLRRLIHLLVNDKRNNPSNYSLIILSEGAAWQGYTVKEYGEPDAFGHRKKMSVAEDLSDEIKPGDRRRHRRKRSISTTCARAVPTSSIAWWHSRSQVWPWTRWRRQVRTDDRDQRRTLRDGADSRSEAGPTQSGYRINVRHRVLSPAIRLQGRPADFSDTAVVQIGGS